MKVKTKNIQTMYIYNDGHAVCVYRKHDTKAGDLYWAEAYEKVFDRVDSNASRVIVSGKGMIECVLRYKNVKARHQSIDNGSQNTKAKGLGVGFVSLSNAGHYSCDGIIVYQVEGLSTDLYVQTESQYSSTWSDIVKAYDWSGYRLTKNYAESVKVAS